MTAHAGVSGHIQHRGQGLGDTAGSFLPADHPAQPFLQGRVPPGTPGNAGGQAQRILDKRPAQPFHMESGRNMMGAVFHGNLLNLPLPGTAFLFGVEFPHLQSAHLADTVFRLAGDILPVISAGAKGENTPYLGHFLRKAQFFKESLGPLLRWKRFILIQIAHTLSS